MICDTCKCEVEPIVIFGYNAGGHKKIKKICPNKTRYEHSVERRYAGGYKVDGYDTDNMVISFDDRIPCDVKGCSNIGAEYHHFSPSHLFGDAADNYPTANLCKYHHDNWHMLTNTGSFYKQRVKEEYRIKRPE